MTYRMQFTQIPEGWNEMFGEDSSTVVSEGVSEDQLPELIERAQQWNAEAEENEAINLPLFIAVMTGQALGRLEIVDEAGESIAVPHAVAA